jgi:hypothetical protein
MTTDASALAAVRPFSLNVSPVVLGVAALAASVVMLLIVMLSPGANAGEPSFSPAAISVVRHFNIRMSEMSSVYMETASVREERPPPPPAPAPAARAAAQPVVPAPTRDQVVARGKMTATLTFYDCLVQKFCGAMSNGQKVYEGAAACSYNLAIGTMFTIAGDPTGRVYVCKDRGLLPNTHVDIFWNDPADGWRWQRAVGSRGTIEIVELPR